MTILLLWEETCAGERADPTRFLPADVDVNPRAIERARSCAAAASAKGQSRMIRLGPRRHVAEIDGVVFGV
jgi:hypothetical protein